MAAAPVVPVVWDLETCGLGDTAHIVSVSARCGTQDFHAFVKPPAPIPPEATKVHGITDEMVKNADSWQVVGPRFAHWIREVSGPEPLLVAYNGHRFDLRVLFTNNSTIDPAAFPAFESVSAADPFEVAKRVIAKEQLANYKQCTVYKHLFGAEPAGQHTSQGDVEALSQIVNHDLFAKEVVASARKVCALDGRDFVNKRVRR